MSCATGDEFLLGVDPENGTATGGFRVVTLSGGYKELMNDAFFKHVPNDILIQNVQRFAGYRRLSLFRNLQEAHFSNLLFFNQSRTLRPRQSSLFRMALYLKLVLRRIFENMRACFALITCIQCS